MNFSVEGIIIVGSFLVFISAIVSKFSSEFGVPILLIFLGISMLAGSDGIGGIVFNNSYATQVFGSVTLSLILFNGGLCTDFEKIKTIIRSGLLLSTVGVLLTSVSLGFFVYFICNFSLPESILMGSLVASTDAAAVFSILKSSNLKIRDQLSLVLEFESGSNDAMAYFLTVFFTTMIKSSVSMSPLECISFFLQEILFGALLGLYMGFAIQYIVTKIDFQNDLFYPCVTFSMALLTYGVTNYINGNGFLAVYLAGLVLGKENFKYKEHLIFFHSSTAWIFQMVMYISLGLLVNPSQLPDVFVKGTVISFILMFIARPIGVFVSLIGSQFSTKEKIFLSFVGLRGATSIVFATFPILSMVNRSDEMFNIVFFVVIISVLFQGTIIPFVAKCLKLQSDGTKYECKLLDK